MRASSLFLVPCSAALLALLSCSIITELDPEAYRENNPENCSDGIDNDADGDIDCADFACKALDHCQEDSDITCSDSVDNDLDGKVDCNDPACCTYAECYKVNKACGESTKLACTDLGQDGKPLDNDGNGLANCADYSCFQIPGCCNRLETVILETFETSNSGCTISECSTAASACCSSAKICSMFDPSRWLAWGLPRPRIKAGQLLPNQPCSCPASGLISVADTLLVPGMQLEFEADLQADPAAYLGVGLMEEATIPQSDVICGEIETRYKMLLGVEIEGLGGSSTKAVARAIVGKSVRKEKQGVALTGGHRLQVAVANNGKAEFLLDGVVFHQSSIVVADSTVRVRLLVQGHSSKATLDNLLLGRRTGCQAPGNWTPGPTGTGPVLQASSDKINFDSAAVGSPSVLYDGKQHLLYFAATSAAGSKRVGLYVSPDGRQWTPKGALTVAGESDTWLSDPCVILGRKHKYLMAYRAQSSGQPPVIALATSSDGLSWKRLTTAVTLGAKKQWDDMDVSGPALAFFKPPKYNGKPATREYLHLWYAGNGSQAQHHFPFLGLAIADEQLVFTKATAANPVLRPGASKNDERGVTDPWVSVITEDTGGGAGKSTALHLWYVGNGWKRTGINHAASADGIKWVPYVANPVVTAGDPGFYGSVSVRGPTALHRWGTWHMWYGGADPTGKPAIGYAVNYSD